MISSGQRATKLVALVLFGFLIGAKKGNENLETYKDQISKSQILLLQRDRNQAAQILIGAINKEGVKSPAFLELAKALKKTTEVFFSERAQQSYELALASYPTNRQQTIEKLKETLGLEPMNALVLKALIFSLLSQRDCGAVAKWREDLLRVNPFDDEVLRLNILELVCLKNKTEAQILLAKMSLNSQSQAFAIVTKLRMYGNEANLISAEIRPQEASYPEMVYVGWRLEKEAKNSKLLSERYRSLCSEAISFDRAFFWMDPWVCEHLKEINELKAKGEGES